MIVLIIGLSLSFIAIGFLFYFNRQLKRKLEGTNRALLAFQKEFTNYQVTEKRAHEKDVAREEIRHDNIAKCITKNEQLIEVTNKRMDKMNESLPSVIGQVVGQIEFAQDIIKRK